MSSGSPSHGRGPSQRQLRVGELIRRTLSEALMRGEVHDPDLNRLSITVNEVQVTPDMRIATAFVLPLGGQAKDEAIELLARNKGELRRMLGKKTDLRFTPDLRFRIDDTFDRMDDTRRMFAQDKVRQDIEGPGMDGTGEDRTAGDGLGEDYSEDTSGGAGQDR